MFLKSQIAEVTEYFSGVPQSVTRRQYHIKGSETLYNWVEYIKYQGLEGAKNPYRDKTNYPHSFKKKV